MTKRAVCALIGVCLGVATLPAAADAQLRLVPQAGLYAPVSDLGTVNTVDGARSVGTRDASFAYGLGAELGNPQGTSVRLTGLLGSGSEVPVGGVGCTGSACDARSTVATLTGSVVLRPIPRIVLVRPYLVAGGGLKRYDFEYDEETDVREALGDDSNEVTGQLGVGVEWNLGLLDGTVELSDYVSPSVLEDGGETQHDFFLTVGIFIG